MTLSAERLPIGVYSVTDSITLAHWRQQIALKSKRLTNGFAGEFLLFSASTMAFQFSRLVVSLIVARWVGPDEFGVWNALNLLLLYGIFISLGIPNGMNRNVPLLMGQNKHAQAKQVTDLTTTLAFLVNTAAGLLIIGVALGNWVQDVSRDALLWMGLLFLTWQIYQFFQMHLKSRMQFRLMSIQQISFAVALPLIVLPLAYFWRVPGFIAGQAVVALLMTGLIIYTSKFQIRFVWDAAIFKSLFKIGFPIMAAGLLYSLLTTIDRWVILKFLGVEELGNYTLAILCVSVLSLLPAVISQQMYPRMAFHYGKTQNTRSLQPLIIRQSMLATAVTLPVLIVAYITLPWLITRFLPEYILGITPARILLIGLSFIPLVGGVANFLNTVNKQVYYLTVQAGALILNFSLNLILVKNGLGLNGIAIGAATSYGIYAIVLIIVGIWVVRVDKK